MATVATRVTSAPFARPTDSVTGQIALSRAISGGTLGGVPMRGALDFARSAIGPSTAVPGTDLTFIPFAQDAVTFAVNAASDFPRDVALGSGQQDSLVPAPFTLRNIYRGAIQSYTDSDFNSVPIRPLLPSLGNETRDFWLASLGLSDSTLGSSVVTALGASGDSATTVSGSGDVLPVSVAAYLAQGNHNSLPTSVSETRGSTELGYIGTVKPYAVANNLTTANPYFPVTRLVYTVVETDRLTGGSVDDVTLQVAFAGAGSQLCHAENTIREYGYATIGSRCGNTTSYRQGLR
jgi:ABC-type phosphate transport system substrate-binding protein